MAYLAPKKNIYAVWWPEITDQATAKQAALNGATAAGFCAVITAIVSVGGWLGATMDGLWDAAIFGIVAWGIYKMSRFAAIAGLAIYLAERVYAWTRPGAHPNPVMAIIFTLFFIGGVRGTIAHRRYRNKSQ